VSTAPLRLQVMVHCHSNYPTFFKLALYNLLS